MPAFPAGTPECKNAAEIRKEGDPVLDRRTSIRKREENWFNNLSIRAKLITLFVFCVFLPMALTDTMVIGLTYTYEHRTLRENIGSAVEYQLSDSVSDAAIVAKNIYLSEELNDFLDYSFASPLDHYTRQQELLRSTLFNLSLGMQGMNITLYADNDTIINGGNFQRLSDLRDTAWYTALANSGSDMILVPHYETASRLRVTSQRQVSFVRRMNYYLRDPVEKVVRIDLDYSGVNSALRAAGYEADVFVCWQGKIIFSNAGYTNVQEDFVPLSPTVLKSSYDHREFSLYGTTFDIYLVDQPFDLKGFAQANGLILAVMVLLNLTLPTIWLFAINRSFADRLTLLTGVVETATADKMPQIQIDSPGKDEIGRLLLTYNHMAARIDELVETVYKARLREQETDIARQNAELLALRSQINPHFLFNTLESIRMRSLLKGETETADMIGRLALIERQYVDWKVDVVLIAQELRYVETYLRLQQYRFGERFSYSIERKGCETLCIPKLTLLTFVENACVHGIASKASHGWVFVRAVVRGGDVVLSVEDTGVGMNEEQRAAMERNMREASIDLLRKCDQIGVINACLRLKMATQGRIRFDVESEENVGTTFTITIPADALETGKLAGRNLPPAPEGGTSNAESPAGGR